MKKTLMGLSAFIFAAALVGCSADKEKSAEKTNDKADTTVASTTVDSKESKDNKESTKAAAEMSVSFKDLAGPYHKTGHMTMGEYPGELDPKKLEETLKNDPMTISEDGTLHFCGKDYKLSAEGMDDENAVFSIEGSGFDFEKYKKASFSCSSKDYEGPCTFMRAVQHMTINDEDHAYTEYRLYLTQKGEENYFGYIIVDQGEASESDWNWGWDDDGEDTTIEE
ncbi:hypothetical protein [Ruminococcus flavefaciens]|uniref:Lipoprotein n=1 Tax=Ruminococcus flavefaciens 007c TaxID=1341157 RepID=W7UCY3_RUMFL|nr:hypothetical protein [Ruminococcus flavefaciens]EWM52931.1 hypothetical protein RF007C_15065 [Ruminococcus flavefaciens 007c]